MFGFVYAGLIWITPWFQNPDGQFPFYYYMMVLIIYALHQVRPRHIKNLYKLLTKRFLKGYGV